MTEKIIETDFGELHMVGEIPDKEFFRLPDKIEVDKKFLLSCYELAEVHLGDKDILGLDAIFIWAYIKQVFPEVEALARGEDVQERHE